MKSPNLRHSRGSSQNKGLSKFQRTARLQTIPSPLETGRQAGQLEPDRGNIGPRKASSTKLKAGTQLLTKTSWDSGWLASTGRVTARDQLPRRDAWHTLDRHAHCHPGNQASWTGEVIRYTPHLGRLLQAPGHLSCWDLGRAQNTGPTESTPLWSTQEPYLSSLDLGSAHNPGPASDRRTSRSNIDPEKYKLGKCTHPELGKTQCSQVFEHFPCQ